MSSNTHCEEDPAHICDIEWIHNDVATESFKLLGVLNEKYQQKDLSKKRGAEIPERSNLLPYYWRIYVLLEPILYSGHSKDRTYGDMRKKIRLKDS